MQDQRLPLRYEGFINSRFGLSTVILVGAIGFTVGIFFAARVGAGSLNVGQPSDVDFSPVWKAWSIMDQKFVPAAVASTTPIASSTAEANQQRVWGMIAGLADSLNDPYTFFLPPKENQQFAEDMSGEFSGVGMEVGVRDEQLVVISPLKGTPAERAGIRSGDRIIKIDDVDTRGLDIDTAVSKIRGPKGTVVTLTIGRDGWSEPREIKVTREVINAPTILTKQEGDIFIIQLYTFTANSPELFRGALREFVESGKTKLIFDLRGNPGGYLDAAVDMASWFLPSGRIVVTEDYAGHAQNVVHRSRGYDIFNDNLKMVILTDKGTASASEILADALRYWGVATLIGTNSFGKGSVQELVEITPTTALKITVARWLGPDDVHIPLEGIKPDIEVERTAEDAEANTDPQMDRAIQYLNTGS